jgi:hypothetical protein
MISAIVSAPFALSIQYLVVNVLSQETMTPEEAKREKQLSKWNSLQKLLSSRKLSVGSEVSPADLVEKCGRSVSEDLENLLKDISGHYKRLLKTNKPKAEEFRGE